MIGACFAERGVEPVEIAGRLAGMNEVEVTESQLLDVVRVLCLPRRAAQAWSPRQRR